jgi:hypothetical protein
MGQVAILLFKSGWVTYFIFNMIFNTSPYYSVKYCI